MPSEARVCGTRRFRENGRWSREKALPAVLGRPVVSVPLWTGPRLLGQVSQARLSGLVWRRGGWGGVCFRRGRVGGEAPAGVRAAHLGGAEPRVGWPGLDSFVGLPVGGSARAGESRGGEEARALRPAPWRSCGPLSEGRPVERRAWARRAARAVCRVKDSLCSLRKEVTG